MELNSKRIRSFLSQLNEAEFHYLGMQISLANDAQRIVKKFNLGKEEFCQKVCIKVKDYDSYLSGSYDYSVKDMAYMQSAYVQLSSEAAAEKAAEEVKKTMTTVVS